MKIKCAFTRLCVTLAVGIMPAEYLLAGNASEKANISFDKSTIYNHGSTITLAQSGRRVKGQMIPNPDKTEACFASKAQALANCWGGEVEDLDCDCDYNGTIWMCKASGMCYDD